MLLLTLKRRAKKKNNNSDTTPETRERVALFPVVSHDATRWCSITETPVGGVGYSLDSAADLRGRPPAETRGLQPLSRIYALGNGNHVLQYPCGVHLLWHQSTAFASMCDTCMPPTPLLGAVYKTRTRGNQHMSFPANSCFHDKDKDCRHRVPGSVPPPHRRKYNGTLYVGMGWGDDLSQRR